MTMVGFLVTLVKAGSVFGLLAFTVKMLRRYDRRAGTTTRRSGSASRRAGGATGRAARGGRSGRAKRDERVIDIVERAQVGRSASVVLIRVQDQHFVLSVTETSVTTLLEVDLPEPDTIDLRADGERHPTLAALSLGEVLRQARQYLPGRQRIEVLDRDELPSDVQPSDLLAGAEPTDQPTGPPTAELGEGSS